MKKKKTIEISWIDGKNWWQVKHYTKEGNLLDTFVYNVEKDATEEEILSFLNIDRRQVNVFFIKEEKYLSEEAALFANPSFYLENPCSLAIENTIFLDMCGKKTKRFILITLHKEFEHYDTFSQIEWHGNELFALYEYSHSIREASGIDWLHVFKRPHFDRIVLNNLGQFFKSV